MKATIDVWQFVPSEDDEPGFLTYRIAGVVDNKPYCAEISIEIDGRDGECNMLWGYDIAPNQHFGEAWDAVLEEMSKTFNDGTDLATDMAERTATFYSS